MLSRLFTATLWSPAGKGLTSWLSFMMFNCVFVTFPCGILGHLWYLIVSIPDLCRLSYFFQCFFLLLEIKQGDAIIIILKSLFKYCLVMILTLIILTLLDLGSKMY